MITDQIRQLAHELEPLTLEPVTPVSELQKWFLDYYMLPLPSEYQYSTGYIDVDGFRICVHIWMPEKATKTVIIVHGYFDHSGLYGHIIRFFLGHSYAVMTFDLPGHGLSSGEQARINHFSEYSSVLNYCLEWASNRMPPVTCLFGQSTGAAVVINSLAIDRVDRRYPGINNIVLFAPLIKIPGWRMTRLIHRIISPFVRHIRRKRTQNSHDRDFLALLEEDPLQPDYLSLHWVGAMYEWFNQINKTKEALNIPVFIVQGQKDQTVDWPWNIPFIKTIFTNTEIVMISEAFHHLANESSGFRKEYMVRLDNWLLSGSYTKTCC